VQRVDHSVASDVVRKASNVVIVSPHFPPSSLAGVHRARHLAKHLPHFGWHPIVLCVDEKFHGQALDPALLALVRPDTETIKVGAISTRLSRMAGVGDVSLRAFTSLRAALSKLHENRRIDAVLITGSPFYPMLLASDIKGRFGVPVVLDFQDPWVSRWGEQQSRFTKAGLSHVLAGRLEPRALRAASFVTSVSDTQNAEMATRYAWLDATRMVALPIGGDPEDFEHLRRAAPEYPEQALDRNRINLSFVGTMMPRSGPLVRLVLQGLRHLRQVAPDIGGRFRLNFIGTSNQPGVGDIHRVLPIANEVGVGDAVFELPERLPYLQAIAILARSDGVLLVGSDEPHYTASKIYPGLMSGRPFISLFHHTSSSHEILSAAGGGAAHAFRPGDDHERLIAEIAVSLRTLVTDPCRFGQADPAAYMPFEARSIAGRFAEIFSRVQRAQVHRLIG
jgi:hypothetical protein